MATNNLELRLAHSTMSVQGTTTLLTEKWQAWQPTLDVVLGEITQSANTSVGLDLDIASASLHKEVVSWFVTTETWHRPQPAIGDYSAFDASHIMEYWAFTPNGANFDLSHVISGAYDDQPVTKDGDRPTIVGRISAILSLVPGPTIWTQADSPSAETLRVTCQIVAGADHYNVYSDLGNGTFELLGSVPNEGLNALSVAAGFYQVRMAAVTGAGIVGVLSNTVSVSVGAIAAAIMARDIIEETGSITATGARVPTIPLCSQRLWNFIKRSRSRG